MAQTKVKGSQVLNDSTHPGVTLTDVLNDLSDISDFSNHLIDVDNPHNVVKSQVGLSNVDNTSDLAKPVSTATQLALDGKAASVHTHAISDVTSLQATLDGKAASVHTHVAADITDFSEAVDDRVGSLLVAGTNVTLDYNDVANTLTVSASGGGGGEANTASNLGAGTGVFAQKSGVDLQFKSLVAGTNITLSNDASTVTINSTGAASPSETTAPFFKDDFYTALATNGNIGELNWPMSGLTVAAAAAGLVDATHSGVAGLVNTSTTGVAGYLYLSSGTTGNPLCLFSNFEEAVLIARHQTGDTTSHLLYFGVTENAATNHTQVLPIHGSYFVVQPTSTNILVKGRNVNGGASADTANLATLSHATYYKLKIRKVNATTMAFSVNGGAETNLSTNIPDGADGVTAFIQLSGSAGGSVSTTAYVDYFHIKLASHAR